MVNTFKRLQENLTTRCMYRGFQHRKGNCFVLFCFLEHTSKPEIKNTISEVKNSFDLLNSRLYVIKNSLVNRQTGQ